MLQSHTRPPAALYVTGLLLVIAAVYGPIAQPDNYHGFADQRTLFGIAHGGDVLSNLAFLAAGLWGLMRSRGSEALLFCGALVLTAFGSAWYHLAPDDQRLVWDRIPIALACAALLAASLREGYGMGKTLAPLLAGGVASVLWWVYSGDLRPYLLIQVAPLLLIPAIQWETQAALPQRRAFALAIGLYVLAKVCEVADGAIFDLQGVISGHTLKHLFAAMAAMVLIKQFPARQRLS